MTEHEVTWQSTDSPPVHGRLRYIGVVVIRSGEVKLGLYDQVTGLFQTKRHRQESDQPLTDWQYWVFSPPLKLLIKHPEQEMNDLPMQVLNQAKKESKAMTDTDTDKYEVVKKCKVIYQPKGQAGEYSRLATNPFLGCGHACVYCYVPRIIRMSRHEFDTNVTVRKNYLQRLESDAKKYQQAGITDTVMLSFTTDPYTPFDEEDMVTRHALVILKRHGLKICTLTKGGKRALRDIDLFYPGKDTFASTLTSLDPKTSLEWEKNAALPQDRLDTLKTFYDKGVFTWVSLEPVISTEDTLEIIKEASPFVDLFKIGRINYHKMTKTTDWASFACEVIGLCESIDQPYYLKEDLKHALAESDKGLGMLRLIDLESSSHVSRDELD